MPIDPSDHLEARAFRDAQNYPPQEASRHFGKARTLLREARPVLLVLFAALAIPAGLNLYFALWRP